MARELKPVSFNTDNSKVDKEILDYIEGLGVSFSSYVKLLIRKDMLSNAGVNETPKTAEMAEIANQLKELVNVFKTGNVSIGTVRDNSNTDTDIETVIAEPEETEEERKQRLAMESFLGMGG